MNVKQWVGGMGLLMMVGLGTPSQSQTPSTPSPSKAPAPKRTITVAPGKQRELKHKNLTRVALGNDAIADVEVTGEDTLRITGRQVGKTTLLLWSGQGERHAYLIVVGP